MEDHIKRVHDKVKDHMCQLCGSAYANIEEMKIHVRHVHLEVKNKSVVISYWLIQKAHQKVSVARVTDNVVKIVSIDVRFDRADDYLCSAD